MHTKKENKFPNVLREERERYGLSYKRAAVLMDIKDPQVISMWEDGTAAPNMESLMKLIVLYHCDPATLWQEYYSMIRGQLQTVWKKAGFNGLLMPIYKRSFDDND